MLPRAQPFRRQRPAAAQARRIRARLATLLRYKAFCHMTCGPSTVDLTTAADSGAVILFDLASMGHAAGDTFGKLIVAQLVGNFKFCLHLHCRFTKRSHFSFVFSKGGRAPFDQFALGP